MFFTSVRKALLYAMKIYGAIIASLTISTHAAADIAAIIGEIDLTGTGPAYTALVSSSGDVTPLALPGEWNFSIQEKISYVNTQSFNAGKVNAFLVGSPGSFTVETLSSAQNLGVAQLAMSFDPLNARYPTSTLFYQGEFGTHYQSHQINIELAWQF